MASPLQIIEIDYYKAVKSKLNKYCQKLGKSALNYLFLPYFYIDIVVLWLLIFYCIIFYSFLDYYAGIQFKVLQKVIMSMWKINRSDDLDITSDNFL